LEIFQSKKYEVLFMLEPIDEWVIGALFEYKKKPLKSVDKGDLTLDEKDKKKIEAKNKAAQEKYQGLLD
jgi:molecular chaperone HtpG